MSLDRPLERRSVLKGGLAAAALGGPFAGFAASPAVAKPDHGKHARLVPIPDERDGAVRLHLPEGFKYRSFHDSSMTRLPDGTDLPPNHDGMGAFSDSEGGVILVRNHELNNPDTLAEYKAFGPTGTHTYDSAARGGTTTIHVDRHGNVAGLDTSLNGTLMNCSGGPMPWGAWITCEETINGPDVGPDFTGNSNEPLQKRHGYIFEVPTDDRSSAEPIRSAGRFAHEAVSFDHVEGILYLTEDNFGFASGFYRYTPPAPSTDALLDGGTLEMLKVADEDNAHLEGKQRKGASYDVEWVTIDNPDFGSDVGPATRTNDQAIRFVGDQGRAQGGAYFSRLEGQVYEDGVVYFCSTQGGGKQEDGVANSSGYGQGLGQIWAYDTRAQTLTCIYQSRNERRLDFPDNVTSHPDSGTLVVCEDHDNNNYLHGLSRDGKIWAIALNRIPGMFDSEFAGSTFSPDGKTLYVNIQDDPALSFAIWGPWRSIGV